METSANNKGVNRCNQLKDRSEVMTWINQQMYKEIWNTFLKGIVVCYTYLSFSDLCYLLLWHDMETCNKKKYDVFDIKLEKSSYYILKTV